ncbi:MAG TPA: biotin--[acetyl-CoA-carboxylase] ligase [Rubricoccaceae bacterium]
MPAPPPRPLGHPSRHLAAVGSTMTEAAAWAAAGAPHGAVVVAAEQTAGRGRHGRAWTAAPGESRLVSVVLRPALAPERLALVGLAAGLAAAEAADTFGADARLKWPNDVLAPGADGALAKLAGVLAEASWTGPSAADGRTAVVLGLGLNVRQTAFPDGLAATSLRITTGRDLDRLAPLGPFLERLAERLAEAERAPDTLLAAVEARLVGVGEPRSVRFPGTERAPVVGVVLGLAGDGALRLGTSTGALSVHAGEVTLAG